MAQARAVFGEYDLVTRLPSRHQFLKDFPDRDALAQAGPLMLVTLSTAGHYNQLLRVLGHDAADHFVIECAERLIALLSDQCSRAYHVSVMSFAFCLPADGSPSPEALAAAIQKAFEATVTCRDLPVNAGIGIGVLETSRRAFDPAEALRAVMTAAQASRMQSDTAMRWYDRDTDEAFKRSFMLLTDLRHALHDDPAQLSLHYQPKMDLASGRITSAEALMRWQHPRLGAISPGEFIPLAEATALIQPLTQFVMEHAVAALSRWQEGGLSLNLSANISPANLNETDFIDHLLDRLHRGAVARGTFELEFTEGVLNDNQHQMLARLERLVDEGIEIAIDDFGSGYSNLSYLADLPATTLKIDQSFVRPMDEDPQKQRLVQSIIGLGKSFDYRLVAEGIETDASLRSLTAWGCDTGQGYFIARPMPEQAFMDWVGAR
nr:GGDEF domain-containing phosphodiesterase [Aquisalinus flavus]